MDDSAGCLIGHAAGTAAPVRYVGGALLGRTVSYLLGSPLAPQLSPQQSPQSPRTTLGYDCWVRVDHVLWSPRNVAHIARHGISPEEVEDETHGQG